MERMNKKIVILFLSGMLGAFQQVAAQRIETLYVNMPDGLNPVLTKQNRLELIEYAKAGQGDSVINRFGKPTYLLSRDTLQQSLRVQNTPGSTFEMKLLRLADGKPAIGIIRTVCAPVCQSAVEFYDTAWTRLPLRFTMPRATEWINTDSIAPATPDYKWVETMLATGYMSLRFGKTDDSIIVENNTLQILSEDDRRVIGPMMLQKLFTYRLKGQAWVKE